ncbi:DUF4190 domain-containing protein [Nocardioides montaniterrae]
MSETNEPGQPNNPDPYGDAPTSNPYGSAPQNPYAPPPAAPSAPYGQPPAAPYGQPSVPPSPYEAPNANPYAAPPAPPYGSAPYGSAPYGQPGYQPLPTGKTDGISIAAMVTSIVGLLVCLPAPVGIVLGFVGLSRTKQGRAGGRGFALTGVIVGFIGVLIWGVILAFAIVDAVKSNVTPDNAKTGQCVDVDRKDNTYSLSKTTCDEDHDAQIMWVGTFGEIKTNVSAGTALGDLTESNASREVCSQLVGQATITQIGGGEAYNWALIGDKKSLDNPSDGDKYVCLLEGRTKLTSDLLH